MCSLQRLCICNRCIHSNYCNTSTACHARGRCIHGNHKSLRQSRCNCLLNYTSAVQFSLQLVATFSRSDLFYSTAQCSFCCLVSCLTAFGALCGQLTFRLAWMPRTLSSYGDRTFAAAGPRLWNSLSVQLCNPDITYGLFIRQLKGHLFREA